MKILLATTIFLVSFLPVNGQIKLGPNFPDDFTLSYENPQELTIGGITVSGTDFLDQTSIKSLSGLSTGDKIQVPGEAISNAIQKLWEQGILSDVAIDLLEVKNGEVFLSIRVRERPRLSGFVFEGVNKNERESLTDKIKLIRGKVISDALIKNTQLKVKKHFTDKGFLRAKVEITQRQDSMNANNYASLIIKINKNKKVKINRVLFTGNEKINDAALKKQMRRTKEKIRFTIPDEVYKAIAKTQTIRMTPKLQSLDKLFMPKHIIPYVNEHVRLNFLSGSKFVKADYEEDKKRLIAHYNSLGYRDAILVHDSISDFDNNSLNLHIEVDEGKKYFFRNIYWKGNFVYDSAFLSRTLSIQKGDVYNMAELDKRLHYNPLGDDIMSLYMDNGYLFFSIEPKEILVEGDSIDLEMQIHEGVQATINKIYFTGNTRTFDPVILREIRTLPGQKFNRSLLIRTQREIAQLGYFDAEKTTPVPIPNAQDGTVDIEYQVVEKSNDQIEMSMGLAPSGGAVGTLGVVFNNFSARNLFNPGKWGGRLPIGGGQRLAIRMQSNGFPYQTYSMSFMEPWLGGKRSNALTVGVNHSINRNYGMRDANIPSSQKGQIQITGVSVGLGRQLNFPDDYFSLSNTLNYNRYSLTNYGSQFGFRTGTIHNVNFNTTLSRSSISDPIFPRSGSTVSLNVAITPPWSSWGGKSLPTTPTSDTLKTEPFNEYHKWMFDASYFISLSKRLVLNTRAHFGYLGYYNHQYHSNFERFDVGGDGLTSNSFLLGQEIIGLRGYQNHSLNPYNPAKNTREAGIAYNKFVLEARYLVTTSSTTPMWLLAFAEGANNYSSFRDYNPFKLYRSVGVGARIFMPYLGGLLGVDFGYGFDEVPGMKDGNKKRLNISMGIPLR